MQTPTEPQRNLRLEASLQEYLRRVRQRNEQYRYDFLAFLRDCVWTVDAGRGGEVRPWPFDGNWEKYWVDWHYAVATQELVLVDKVRRMMASNFCCAWDWWIASGGIDPRWEALTRSTHNRRVLIQSRKLDGPGGSKEFLERIRLMYEISTERGLRKLWPSFPVWKFYSESAKSDQGGRIEAVPQGPDQTRGAGITLLHAEELSFWEEAQETLEIAVPTIAPEGHIMAITTPASNTYAHRLRMGEGRKLYFHGGSVHSEKVAASDGIKVETPEEYLSLRKLPNGWSALIIRGEHVPGWVAEEVGKGLSEHAFRREVLGDWHASVGKVVFPNFSDFHIADAPLPFDPDLQLVCGWDFPAPTGGLLAFVPTQLSEYGQWLIYPPVVQKKDESIGVYEFAERVAEYLLNRFALPYNRTIDQLHLVHWGDPVGAAPPPNPSSSTPAVEASSSYDIVRKGLKIVVGVDAHNRPIYEHRKGWGWSIKPGAVSSTDRLESMRARLTMLLPGGKPAMLVDPDAKELLDGFRGSYHYKERQDGTYDSKPHKNEASDPMDAACYVASRLFAARKPEQRDEGTRWMQDLVRQTRHSRPAPGRRMR